MEDLLGILQTILEFIREYKIFILIGIGILFIDRVVSFINALFTLFGNFGRAIGKIFRFIKVKSVILIRKVIWIFSSPIRAYRRHEMKRSDFYVVPD